MGIERNAGGGSFIKEAGQYKVKIASLSTGLSKSQKPMLTVLLRTDDDLTISAYFVKELKFHQHTLKQLKTACGLKPADPADDLLGKECGILVEPQDPTPDGKVFMSITGYGLAKDVGGPEAPNFPDDQIPF